MSDFLTPVDIANRGLQHCGAERIDLVQGFSENSRNAQEIRSLYDKLRKDELERSLWTFATRQCVLRPIDSNTRILTPTLWSSITSYSLGMIVSDEEGTLWESKVGNNTGNIPVLSYTWAEYNGPLSVALYDSSKSYFNEDLVYVTGGDGTYQVYRSMQNSNTVDPSLPNQWLSTTVYQPGQIVQKYPAYSIFTTYTQGQGALFTDGNVYVSLINGNINNAPPVNPTKWALLPVLVIQSQPVPSTTPMIPPQSSPVIEWSSSTTYALGATVMFNGRQYVALFNNLVGTFPTDPSGVWKVISGGIFYSSLIDFNINNNPSNLPASWDPMANYLISNTVAASNGSIYTALTNNSGINPASDNGTNWLRGPLVPWAMVPVGGNQMWRLIGGTLFPMGVGLIPPNITYPIDVSPIFGTPPKSIYRLPAGYLRKAPLDPTQGSISWLGAPTNLPMTDWEFGDEYFTSRDTNPITFRFVANTVDVRTFNAKFCEMLAARIGFEACEILTQSTEKLNTITSIYKEHERTAILINAIEVGPIQQPLDDWIATRY